MRDKASQPTVMIAVPVAEDQPVKALGLDAEQVEIAHQDLRRVAKIEQVLPDGTAGVLF